MSTPEKVQAKGNGQQALEKKATATRQRPLEKKSSTIYSYKDLLVWQKSMNLVEAVYLLSFKFPASEQWGLISQMRRAAVSVHRISLKATAGKPPENTSSPLYWPRFIIGVGNSSSIVAKTQIPRRKPCSGHAASIEEISKMLGSLINKLR